MLRFYNINEGQVLIDDEDLDRYDVLNLRESCGYVMQEPVLFNQDIKKNILFGKPEATDEEVYIAAQKANAIPFIEGTVENLTDEQAKAKVDQQLNEAFVAKKTLCPNVYALKSNYNDRNNFGKEMLVDLLNCASDDLLKKVNERITMLKEAIDHYIDRFGASWEDIIIRFEWQDELTSIKASQSIDDSVKQSMELMLKNFPDLYGAFDTATIQRAIAEGKTDVGALSTLVTDEKRSYRMTIVEKRFSELQYMALDRKRADDGTFTLHEGFSKECGVKGGKLSGGQK